MQGNEGYHSKPNKAALERQWFFFFFSPNTQNLHSNVCILYECDMEVERKRRLVREGEGRGGGGKSTVM